MTLAGWVMFGALASFIMGCGFLIAAGFYWQLVPETRETATRA